MDKKPVLWDKHSEDSKPLRLPKGTPNKVDGQPQTSTQTKNCQYELPKTSINTDRKSLVEDIVASSKLKADAPEWYPSNCSSSKVESSSTERKNKKQHNNLPAQLYGTNEDFPDIVRLKQIINTLTKDPGQFDGLLDLFMETLQPYFTDVIALSIIAQLLVEEAINNFNFRYTSARLCWHIEQNCPEFRAELHLKCKKQLEENMDKRSVLLYLAELYTQLPHLTIYGALLIDCCKQLLSKGGNDNIKCICQALKLTGHSLEYSNKAELEEICTHLKLAKENVNGSVINLINSVINLRSSNWGYSNETSIDADNIMDSYYYGEFGNTTFYRTDGDTFTNEEKEFLTAHLDSNLEYFSDNSDPDDLCDPEPEMDAEIQEAFKEFVQLSKH